MADISEELAKAYIHAQKQERRAKQNEALKNVFKKGAQLIPRGVVHPDSMVKNRHLYDISGLGPNTQQQPRMRDPQKVNVPHRIDVKKGLRINPAMSFDLTRLRKLMSGRRVG